VTLVYASRDSEISDVAVIERMLHRRLHKTADRVSNGRT
jgi:hypothetical protein